jgi:hypothetical protein
MFDDTLVILDGEFGRTIYCQGKLTQTDYGRDHHPGCFSIQLQVSGPRCPAHRRGKGGSGKAAAGIN